MWVLRFEGVDLGAGLDLAERDRVKRDLAARR